MEYISILDEDGIPTGKIKTRDEVHRDGDWHEAAIVAIINQKNHVLLQKRSMTKEKYPGLWDISLASHISAGEDALSTIMRENNEEIGLQLPRDIRVSDFLFTKTFRDRRTIGEFKENQFYNLFVIRKNLALDNISFNDAEVDEVKWADYTELLNMMKSGVMHPRTQWIDFVNKVMNRL
ncbi:MAG: NUDIX domain-containing protein [Rickettsiales bacterium]|jgi:8-oxo-dGTP diphosphatase|nr:NUDIX domain-containing protein [Rickettsiales bacterium]